MSTFQSPIASGQKRSSTETDGEASSKKRKSFGRPDPVHDDLDEITIARDPTKRGEQYWMVQWYARVLCPNNDLIYLVKRRAPQYRKHKTWDGDGVLALQSGKGTLYDMDSKLCVDNMLWYFSLTYAHIRIASGKPLPDGAAIGSFVTLGGKEMEIDRPISREDFYSGRIFSGGDEEKQISSSSTSRPAHLLKKFVPLKPVSMNPVRSVERTPNPASKGLDLQPVDLIQQPSKPKELTHQVTYWSGNWLVIITST